MISIGGFLLTVILSCKKDRRRIKTEWGQFAAG